jgi:hypothetical protein
VSDNVIKLEFKSPHMQEDFAAFLSCHRKTCRNKTYTFTFDQPDGGFPLVRCAACGNHAGRMGWYYDDDPAQQDTSA